MRQTGTLLILLSTLCIGLSAQTLTLEPVKRVKLRQFGIPSGQYSGIARINDSTFAVVHDKSDNIFMFKTAADFRHISCSTTPSSLRNRDPEGIAYLPAANTLFVSGEADQRIIEYTLNGTATGRELSVPPSFGPANRRSNAGFEPLTYNATTNRFWTTTEQGLMDDDISEVRMQSFDGTTLLPTTQYTYRIDAPSVQFADAKEQAQARYAYGVAGLAALDDGSLIVLERELLVKKKPLGSWCKVRLYHFLPENGQKHLLDEFTTHLRLTKLDFANYEGICLGPTLPDGSPSILLINDSQDGAGNAFAHLHEYIKVYKLVMHDSANRSTAKADEELMRAVDYQFNALRNDVVLPTDINGKSISWSLSQSKKERNYVSLEGNTLRVTRMPKGKSQTGGQLTATSGTTTCNFPLTIAPDDDMYGYLYCHMAGTSENTLYAIGTRADRGDIFHPLIANQPIYDAEQMAAIEGGVRDAFICRAHDGEGYLMVTTDMSNRKSRVWFNHGIDLMKSNDLIHWTSTSFDFRKGDSIFSDPDSKDIYADWTKVNRVWAPQIIWNPDYNNGNGGYLIYYSMLSTNEGDTYDRIFYSYADKDFNTLTKPQLLHDHGISVIDCHIDWNDCDRQYHVFYKKEGAPGIDRGVHEAVFDRLHSDNWRDIIHITNEGKEQVEGPSAFRLINENRWKVAYIRYSGGKAYKVCNANATETDIDKGVVIGTDVNPQHGSFMTITHDEYELLQLWSDLTMKAQSLEAEGKTAQADHLRQVLATTYRKDAVHKLLKLYRKEWRQAAE